MNEKPRMSRDFRSLSYVLKVKSMRVSRAKLNLPSCGQQAGGKSKKFLSDDGDC